MRVNPSLAAFALLVSGGCAARPPVTETTPVIALAGEIDFGTGDVSPDGRLLAEIDWGSGDIRLTDLQTSETRGLTGEGYEAGGYAWTSAFSRDGRRVAFSWWDDAARRHGLRLAHLDSTSARVLVQPRDGLQYIDPLDWSPDDSAVVLALRGDDRVWRIAELDLATDSLRILKTLSWLAPGGEQTYPRAHLSSDGRFLAYDYRPDPEAYERDIYLMPMAGGEEARIELAGSTERVLSWLPDDSGLLVYSDLAGTPGVWTVPVRDGRVAGEPRLLRADLAGLIPLGLTSGGYLFGRTTGAEQVHVAAIDPVAGAVIAPARSVADPPARISLAGDWSPDGSRLAYVTQDPRPAGTESLLIRSADGELIREIHLQPSFHSSTGTLRWIDENRIVLFGSERGEFGVHELDPRTGRTRRLPVAGEGLDGGNLKWVEVAPDGRTLYLFRAGAGGRAGNELISIDTESGRQTVLGVYDADPRTLAVSPDGSELALVVRDRASGATSLIVRPSGDSGVDPRVLVHRQERPGLVTPISWTPDGTRIVYAIPEPPNGRGLWSIEADGGPPPVRIGGESWCCRGHDLRFHSDGRRVAFPGGAASSEVWLLRW